MAVTTVLEAERIRRLHASGVPVARIAQETGFRERRVYAVLQGATKGRPLTARERMELDREAGWSPLCMDAAEWADWQARNPTALDIYSAVARPCEDCLLGFAADMRAAGRCNGEPGGAAVDDDDTTNEEEEMARGPMSDEARARIAAGRRAQIERERAERLAAQQAAVEAVREELERRDASAALDRELDDIEAEAEAATREDPERYNEAEDDFPQRFVYHEGSVDEPNVEAVGEAETALAAGFAAALRPEADSLVLAYRSARELVRQLPLTDPLWDSAHGVREALAYRIADRAADAA